MNLTLTFIQGFQRIWEPQKQHIDSAGGLFKKKWNYSSGNNIFSIAKLLISQVVNPTRLLCT